METGSGEYTIEYIFKATTAGLENGIAHVEGLIERAKDSARNFGENASEAFYEAVGSVNDLDLKTQALMATLSALETKFAKDSLETFATYEDAIYGMATTVANVGGTIEQAFGAIEETTANGLLSETESARAINNLTAYGFSVAEATELVKALTVSVEAHGKRTQDVSENVLALTEGIKRQSSQMVRSQGYTETLAQMQENYAQSIGKTRDELTDAERRQAEYNALIADSNAYLAVATAYDDSYSASVQRMNNSIEDLKVAFGQAIAPLASLLADLLTWVAENKEIVTGILTFVGVIAGAGGLVVALSKLLPMISAAISWFNGLHVATRGIIVGLATVATTMAVISLTSSKLNSNLEGLTKTQKVSNNQMKDYTQNVGGAVGATRDLSNEIEKLNRQYKNDLKQIANRHQETINKLTKQIQDANVDYRRAIDERNAEFEVNQAREERTHQEKVDEIMSQIAFLQRYNNDYNRQKLTNLQIALERENKLYQKQTEAEREELEIQNENDRKAYEEKRQQLQAELDEELAFMNKHREELAEVQNWILEDEIESLRRRYEEQQASYAEQTALAGSAGTDIANSLIDSVNDVFDDADFSDIYEAGATAGNKFSKGFFNYLWEDVGSGESGILADIWKFLLGEETFNSLMSKKNGSSGSGWADGGYTGAGGKNEVAGIVHKGEYVLPQEMVDQNTGTPKALGNTYVINVSGTFATSASERRKVAQQIVDAINQTNRARLEA